MENINILKEYYEKDSERFWDPLEGMCGRDLDVYPLLEGLSGQLIEYGCGSGSLLIGLAKEERFENCIGVDISERAIAFIDKAWKNIPNVDVNKLKLMNPQSDSLPEISIESMDVIVSVATIEHVLDPYKVLDELYRIAKPTATLICSVPNYAYLKHRIQLLFGIQPRTGTDEPVSNWREEGWDGMHLHTFTKSSFTTLLKDCGWIPNKWMGCGTRFNSIGLGYFRRKFPGIMSGELISVCRKRS
ncbi:class I SAM-dependent methyltransferase [Endozoicomonas sp. SM1973]|uniref:Class I SAM-dependent methyltransferase n=1 Tax=Spartinivicinus marinus TaxID=2994442 RepID=A0A853I4M0_9GAMM|nr:class I SAM-dependent methyltransferase [Spartinivicinus marinus]MCX4028806.1 class I SAM-dependent methyltransferase [Spartinivicinus marinus]NYZ67619.1 class I SAM-dependent methyltransferase [Spartinivicinus marinus]